VISCFHFQADRHPADSRPLNLLNEIVTETPEVLSQTEFNGGTATAFRSKFQHRLASHHPKETEMKLALIGAAAIAAAAFASPALAQPVVEDPGYCAQFYPDANCQNLGPANPYTDGGYYRDSQNGYAMLSHHAMESAEPDAYRYHGGPKSND
jgi:hypothetical protein